MTKYLKVSTIEFLTNMFGLSGARGRYPCLWCEIPTCFKYRNLKEKIIYRLRTLDTLKENQLILVNKHNSNLKHAKDAFNVLILNWFAYPDCIHNFTCLLETI